MERQENYSLAEQKRGDNEGSGCGWSEEEREPGRLEVFTTECGRL